MGKLGLEEKHEPPSFEKSQDGGFGISPHYRNLLPVLSIRIG